MTDLVGTSPLRFYPDPGYRRSTAIADEQFVEITAGWNPSVQAHQLRLNLFAVPSTESGSWDANVNLRMFTGRSSNQFHEGFAIGCEGTRTVGAETINRFYLWEYDTSAQGGRTILHKDRLNPNLLVIGEVTKPVAVFATGGYQSADGTVGLTRDVLVGVQTLRFKNGLLTAIL